MLEQQPNLQIHSISTQVYHALKKEILSGELQPGARLIVLDIAGKFGISQAPVREALERLKQEGLIVGVPNKGSVVSDISSKEIHDIFVLREIIEGFAVRTTMPLLTEEDYRRLEDIILCMDAAIKRNDLLDILEQDMEFHGYFYRRCDNQAILELWGQMRTKVMRFMAISNRHYTTDGLVEWHRLLIEKLRQGDEAAAEHAFIEHMHAYKAIHLA
ncbi:GntR family transcriptional regulator [Cohnella sp. REN36]|uniref:GntR family transcriptional regulator n=1 Tax=Cohnella sp. REN36 TaxID=2887347 RepID=UPI001D14E74A|nr:GntR family transcriptional regulator [Cohnella sp. REN36]MCC3375767.1 GntR family transcriptional regulator [Cohnella sp. REN36]